MSGSALMNTYGTHAITIVRGEGPYLWDAEGRRYLDAISGIAVCGLGYSHPSVTQAICEQSQTLIHCSNLYGIEPQQKLGKLLRELSGMDKVFFANSGAEANEAAIKIARKFGNDKGIGSPEIITTSGSFHGRTMATLSATGNPKVQSGFAPLVSGFVQVEFNNVEAVAQAGTNNTVAVMVEPVQGEGGIRVPDPSYLSELRALCDEKGWLLILDEIQTGNGRTGRYFGHQLSSIKPDVMTTAKGLGNGVPIGACLARGEAAEVLQPGNHGSTFGGNPLATAAGVAVLETLQSDGMLERISQLGNTILAGLEEELADVEGVSDIRGLGLLIGVELSRDCGELVGRARDAGLLINVTAGSTVRLLPPFILSDEQCQELISGVASLIRDFCSEGA
jgi:acetylornithine/N-succinyldiaminopimelate aminotransferase